MKKLFILLISAMILFTACANEKVGGAIYDTFQWDESSIVKTETKNSEKYQFEFGIDAQDRYVQMKTFHADNGMLMEEARYQYFDDGSHTIRTAENPSANTHDVIFRHVSSDKRAITSYEYSYNSKENIYTLEKTTFYTLNENSTKASETNVFPDGTTLRTEYLYKENWAYDKILSYENDVLFHEMIYNDDNSITAVAYQDGKVKSKEITYRNDIGTTIKVEKYDGDGNLIE